MKPPNRVNPVNNHLKHLSLALALGWAASAAFLADCARADTTINSGDTVAITDPNTYFGGAGTLTINGGATLTITGAQAVPPTGYTISNALIFTGNADTIINLRFNNNDTKWDFSGPITGTASGNQIIAITTGTSGNGDREDVLFSSPIPNGSAGTIGFSVAHNVQSAGNTYVNLSAVNTFTGPITVTAASNVGGGTW